jgi:hypothetical protein
MLLQCSLEVILRRWREALFPLLLRDGRFAMLFLCLCRLFLLVVRLDLRNCGVWLSGL